jgi:uncharacterized protein YcaQ
MGVRYIDAVRSIIRQMHILQIDSINVIARSPLTACREGS